MRDTLDRLAGGNSTNVTGGGVRTLGGGGYGAAAGVLDQGQGATGWASAVVRGEPSRRAVGGTALAKGGVLRWAVAR